MYTKPILVWLAILIASYSHAQFHSAESHGKAGASIANRQLSSVFNNPAGTAYVTSAGASAQYLLPYQLTELSTKQLGVVLPTNFGVFSGVIKQYGFKLYNESTFSLIYSRTFGENLGTAFQLNYEQINFSSNTPSGQIYSSLGINFSALKTVNMGLHLVNPENAKINIGEESYRIPSVFIYGFQWNPTADFSLSTEVEKQSDYSAIYKLGFEYELLDVLSIRTGFRGKPVQYCLGVGLIIRGVSVDAAVSHHPALGMSSSVGLNYQFKSRK